MNPGEQVSCYANCQPAPGVKNYTEADVNNGHIYVNDYNVDLWYAPLEWQRMGLSQTRSGYGARLTGSYKIQFQGKFYRTYHTCYGNASSSWFTTKGRRIYVA